MAGRFTRNRAEEATESICKHWVREFGIPETIIDGGGTTEDEKKRIEPMFKIEDRDEISHHFRE